MEHGMPSEKVICHYSHHLDQRDNSSAAVDKRGRGAVAAVVAAGQWGRQKMICGDRDRVDSEELRQQTTGGTSHPSRVSSCRLLSGMALSWLCREPLKATAPINFGSGPLSLAATNAQSRDLLRNLTQDRGELLELMNHFRNGPDEVRTAYKKYLANVLGFKRAVEPQQTAAPEGGVGESTGSVPSEHAHRLLSRAILFKWSDNVSGQVEANTHVDFEIDQVTLNYAIWLTKHAAWIIDYADTSVEGNDAAKDIFNSLKEAAGVFQYFLQRTRSEIAYNPNTDFDERMLDVRLQQAIAEAQEVTLDRGRQLGHKPGLLSSIARDLSEKFQNAADALTSMDNIVAKRLRAYCNFKAAFYRAYMYCYAGLAYFQEEKCGDALGCYQGAAAAIEEAKTHAKAFSRAATAFGSSVHSAQVMEPSRHVIFTTLERTLKEAHDKAHRENGFIYFHKVPAAPPTTPDAKCLTEPTALELPVPLETWQATTWDATKVPYTAVETGASSTAKKGNEDVKFSPFDPEKDRRATRDQGRCTIS
ncbi:uncharacterized protein MONBRDRAFT_32015 [Monosiga brevicollis MX1]|uniref:BRO1 domain-containing protein n=1 Tax=Monosiga brevicollis TaxID=81824 RepID=A9UWW1_MONBE|nr:uncharacterized protein MONBRDRAFT_32015 [Monosiga brevicollis MX1]EDQ90284.1 predicted protein [Monosiga brevicollis MX1]|eukprot:XP_001745051.1 hypothetical protein [Monosiga brevicollis MX1]